MKEWKEFFDALLEMESMKEVRNMVPVLFIAMAASVLIALVIYIVRAISVYNMAKSAELSVPWLAFIPILNLYTFGLLAEKAEKRDGTKATKFGVLLLFMELFRRILSALLTLLLLLQIVHFFDQPDEITVNAIVRKALPLLFVLILIAGIAIAQTIIRYVALYRIFMVFSYPNAKLYTLLSVLGMLFISDILEPVFLFLVRKNPPVFSYREQLEQSAASVKTSSEETSSEEAE